ncbi:trypsin-like peptidase domain-containing protein [Gillisia sp. CAL575]|uniref:trypsin-like peptidase domain-containing protein n=1 Tax=Gillisia sp. CAL575 TaxID=985255 RepID=UPI00039DA86D|nr:trypsin-like peptidase domain-containing protein [Gillisia sp. CAL575]
MQNIISQEQIEKITIPLTCGDSNGSSFFVKENILLTARHNLLECLEEGEPIKIFDKEYGLTNIIAEDKSLDMCLIEVDFSAPIFSLIITKLFYKQTCTLFGFPTYSQTNGDHLTGNVHKIATNSPFDISILMNGIEDIDYSGLSGGPVVSNGKLIGMSRSQNGNEIGIVSFKKASYFLNSNEIVVVDDPSLDQIPHGLKNTGEYSIDNTPTENELNNILSQNVSWIICTGSPGSGKTFCASNFEPSEKKNIICGKYFIKIPHDDQPLEVRTSTRSLIRWMEVQISQQLNIHIDQIEKLEDRISRIGNLLLQLSLSDNLSNFIFLIDGLDEVKNIDSFLGIFPAELPSNIKIILFCIDKEILPHFLKRTIQSDFEVKLKSLKIELCENFIQSKLKDYELSIDAVQKLAIKSEGHPLYLNYLVNSLLSLNLGTNQVEDWIESNPKIEGDISLYYQSLWNNFFKSKERLWIISTISQFRKPIEKKILINSLPDEIKFAFYSEYSSIEYLTAGQERIELYHQSFKDFITSKVPEILPVIHDNIYKFCESNKNQTYQIENWLYHYLQSSNSKRAVDSCEQTWADDSCLMNISPDLVIEDIRKALSISISNSDINNTIRILLLLQRIEFRYDSVFADNSFELCKSMISFGNYEGALNYLIRDNQLLVSDSDALHFLQQFYESEATSEANILLEVLESNFRKYIENEFTKPKEDEFFSIKPWLIIMHAHALSIYSKGEEGIKECMRLQSHLKRFQDSAIKDGADDAAKAFADLRETGVAYFNAYTLRYSDLYISIDKLEKMTPIELDNTWAKLIALTLVFFDDFNNYDTGLYLEKTDNYKSYIKDIEYVIDTYGLEQNLLSLKVIFKALFYDSYRTDILENLIENIKALDLENITTIKAENGVDPEFSKVINIEFTALCNGFIYNKSELPNLPNISSRRKSWEYFLMEVIEKVHFLEGVLVRKSNHDSTYQLITCKTYLKNILNLLDFNLAERAYWDRSYFIPELILPEIYSKITNLYISFFPEELNQLSSFLTKNHFTQLGLYNEGYRKVLSRIIENLLKENEDFSLTKILITNLNEFVKNNLENRWERTPESLSICEYYNYAGDRDRALQTFQDVLKTSMGPSWYKEAQYEILNRVLSLPDTSNFVKNADKIAFLLDEASGEMTFQRYVRVEKESFIGNLTKKKMVKAAIDYYKFEILPPKEMLIKNAEFYNFDQLEEGESYNRGALNIRPEGGILQLIKNTKLSPEIKIIFSYIFILRDEVFRFNPDFSEIIAYNLNEINDSNLKIVLFDLLEEIYNSNEIKGEERILTAALNKGVNISTKTKINNHFKKKSLAVQLNLNEVKDVEKETNENDAFGNLNNKLKTFKNNEFISKAIKTFDEERVSIWMRRWSTTSIKTKELIKDALKDSNDLLAHLGESILNQEEESWVIADEILNFGERIFNSEEVLSINKLVQEHISLITYRNKTVSDKYNWLKLENYPENNLEESNSLVFELLQWFLIFPEESIRFKAYKSLSILTKYVPEIYIPSLFQTVKSTEPLELRVLCSKIIVESFQEDKIKNFKIGKIVDQLIFAIKDSDLIYIKTLKDVFNLIEDKDYEKLLQKKITNEFNSEIYKGGDIYFDDKRFEVINFELELLSDKNYLHPKLCKELSHKADRLLTRKEIILLQKQNKYTRQSFPQSKVIPDFYRERTLEILNKSIMAIVNLENLDEIYDIINN